MAILDADSVYMAIYLYFLEWAGPVQYIQFISGSVLHETILMHLPVNSKTRYNIDKTHSTKIKFNLKKAFMNKNHLQVKYINKQGWVTLYLEQSRARP